MILKECETAVKDELRNLESMPIEEGAYEMWKKQTLTRLLFANLELAYYMDLKEEGIDWRSTIEVMLSRAPRSVVSTQKEEAA